MSVFLPDVCGQNGWAVSYSPSICALKGSTVEMSCNYTYPVIYKNVQIVIENTFWFTKESNGNYVALKDDRDYSDRVKYQCTENSCSLKISNVTQTDSKDYKFRFTTNRESGKYAGSPGVSLSVTGKSYYLSQLDETPITTENKNVFLSSFNTTHRYQCAIKGHEDVPSPAVYAPRTTVLSVTPSETVEGSSVTLTCSSDANPAAKYNIYRVNEGQHGQLLRTGPQSVFSSIQVSDTGRYYCTAGNDLGSQTSPSIDIDVKYGPKSCSVSVNPSGTVEEGNPVSLTCSSDANPAANYTWYKENKIILTGSKVYHVAVGSEHRGNYVCKAQNQHGERNSSSLFLDVLCKFSFFYIRKYFHFIHA
uniref:Ig-like domain-containing protein n=1 Tax=Poecilia mexicana TaxID=48701 RepID=A0A3B3WZK5_9TELE